MKILITGNLGYVGSELVKYFKRKYSDCYIVGYDTAFFSHCITSSGPVPEVYVDKQYFGDVRFFPEKILENIDVVINLAAISNDPMGNKFADITTKINYLSAVQIADLSVKYNVRHYVYASSCSIYGAAEGPAKIESDTLNPLTSYARSKSDSEQAFEKMEKKDMIITALRFSTACGMSDRLRLDLVLNDFVASAVLSQKIEILSDGSPWRPLINVFDMCRAIDWASQRERNNNQFLKINIGSDSWNYQVKDLAVAVSNIIPSVKIIMNENAQPDKRSYKVNFSLFSNLAPEFTPIKTLEETIVELKEGIEKYVSKYEDFRKGNLIRYNILNKYLEEKKYNNQLFLNKI
jgi:nucleoside-diphosphate-sugar epimerase